MLASFTVVFVSLFALFTNRAPSATTHLIAADSLPPLASFLNGSWKCAGGTPSGRVMNADVSFVTTLGDRFLESTHRDQPPGQYMSMGLWPTDTKAHSIATVVYDNVGGSRRFAAVGWGVDSVVWVRDTTEASARMETFTYRRVSANKYWYAWHVRPAATAPVVLGDSATCTRA